MPMKYSVPWEGWFYSAHVAVYHGDASVSVSTGGVEIGQGLLTKVSLGSRGGVIQWYLQR